MQAQGTPKTTLEPWGPTGWGKTPSKAGSSRVQGRGLGVRDAVGEKVLLVVGVKLGLRVGESVRLGLAV